MAVLVALAGFLPASASATTVKLGPSLSASGLVSFACDIGPCNGGETVIQRAAPESVTLVAPADGTVTSWSVLGKGKFRLRVFRVVGESVTGEGTSAVATDVIGGPNLTSLPIRAGEAIGVDLDPASEVRALEKVSPPAALGIINPAAPEGVAKLMTSTSNGNELQLNATMAFAPAVVGLTPSSGQAAGGETVKIFGSNLDGATAVQFGNTPATFAVDAPNQITATAPAMPASTVDVRVIGPGGTSPINAGDRYTFTATSGVTSPTGAGAPGLVSPLIAAKPTLTALGQSASRWRRGHQQAKISRAPVGTTFSFNLSKPATVKLAFTQKAAGRRVRGACKAPNPSNASKRKCVRTIVAGALSLPGHAGLNKLRFQGLLPSGKSLKLGSYNVSLTARDSGGLQSAPHSLSFTIVG
jgi:IPT/TIG domain